MTAYVQTEAVIDEVRLRPCLWNLRDNLYKNKDAKLKAWLEVCEAVCPNFEDIPGEEKRQIEKAVQLRWKTARDAYMKCRATFKTSKSGSAGVIKKKYVYYDIITFLESTKNLESTDESIVATSTQSYYQDVASASSPSNSQSILPIEIAPDSPAQEHTFQAPPRSPKPWQKKRKASMTEFESKLLKIIGTNSNTVPTQSTTPSTMLNDDDFSFFNSLAPIFNDFDNYKKLLFRTRILEVAMEIRGPTTNTPSTSISTATNDFPNLSASDVEDSLESWQHGDYTNL